MNAHPPAAPSTRPCNGHHMLHRCSLVAAFLLAFVLTSLPAAAQAARLFTQQEVESTFPATVYYLGKTAPVQLRNAAAVQVGQHGIFFAGLVDTSGYASGVQETYQMYLLLEQPTHVGTVTLQPGAYGAGFVGDKAVVMDLGGHKLAETKVEMDDHLARPRPLQMVQAAGGGVRLYLGRRWCEVKVDAK